MQLCTFVRQRTINNIPDLEDFSKDVILVLLERNVVKKGNYGLES